jgi:hypothetical protein
MLSRHGTYYEPCIERTETLLFCGISPQTKISFPAPAAGPPPLPLWERAGVRGTYFELNRRDTTEALFALFAVIRNMSSQKTLDKLTGGVIISLFILLN